MNAVLALVDHAQRTGLIEESERRWAQNALLEVLRLDALPNLEVPEGAALCDILGALTDDAASRGLLPADSVTFRDLFDTALMGRLTPRPGQVIGTFEALRAGSPAAATDWFYRLAQDTNYIRRDRIARDLRWQTETAYGPLDITVNLSKPEKDPAAIAAARDLPGAGYPKCQLCAENEGYAGRADHPARQNHRIIPVSLAGERWYFQYSPYVYYNEHCIVLNEQHVPMKIDRGCLEKLLDFVTQFPHYFVGSNADLPIVGGSILAHDHFQGGRYVFPMERAAVETPFVFPGLEDVSAGIVRWPLSVVRLTGPDPARLVALADRILTAWRGYSDPAAEIFAETDGTPHNTVTPIARRRGDLFELDLALRNNRVTPEHPLGLFHPHADKHHIKKENIGLIEVMGLAVLPARLKDELAALETALVTGGDLSADPRTEKHAPWAEGLRERYVFTPENVERILRDEVGGVFCGVLEDAGVYKRTEEGRAAFLRFLQSV